MTTAEAALAAEHSLLSRALQVLTDPHAQAEISASLNLLVRVAGVVPTLALEDTADPWLYFYEDFLAVYDPDLRKNTGAYYTPVEVVRAQVRLIDDLLTQRMGKSLGFADRDVITLDPAVGTGTYLLGVIEHALGKIKQQQGPGAVAGQATELAKNLYGFEVLVGPYAVSELRISRALQDRGASLPPDGTQVYLTDTLESPHTPPRVLPFYLQPIADQHARALEVKNQVPVIVCLGNPPYDRHEAADEDNKAQTGGWVRWGADGEGKTAILNDFLSPAKEAGHGGHLKNLYNLYVYFWRWALWKVFEHKTDHRPGVVSFITASSYLDGDAFCGLREQMRRQCDEIWILDLGGEGRGTRRTENVFDIQTPVAIAVCARYGNADLEAAARVHFHEITGDREEKLRYLDAICELPAISWEECPDKWHAPFRPAGEGKYFTWPLLTDLFPWQHSGAQFKRTWPISPDRPTLENRWRELLESPDRAVAFKETRDRKITKAYAPIQSECERDKPLNELPQDAPPPAIRRYAYRSFDRQWIFADSRLGDYLRPVLWEAHSENQFYLTSLLTKPMGDGPALTACSALPDLDHFSNRGAKDIIPVWRDAECNEANIRAELLVALSKAYRKNVTPQDFFAYVYGVLAQPAFTERYAEQLGAKQLRVPLTGDAKLFLKVRDVGARLLWLHTYAQRYVPQGRSRGEVPPGKARCTRAVPGGADDYPEKFEYNEATATLHVGDGQFTPVSPGVYNFNVSGLKVVQSWLGYRMKKGKGKKSSPLDDIRPERWTGQFTTELLELLWILEATIAEYPQQAQLLASVVSKPVLML